MKLKLHWGYIVISFGYMGGIFVLSDLPDRGGGGLIDGAPELLLNLLHIPLFAGLTWCLLMSLCDGRWSRTGSRELYAVIWLLAGTYAGLDEWHQSFVPGRFASIDDFMLDCLGIAGLLVLHSVSVNVGVLAKIGISRRRTNYPFT